MIIIITINKVFFATLQETEMTSKLKFLHANSRNYLVLEVISKGKEFFETFIDEENSSNGISVPVK